MKDNPLISIYMPTWNRQQLAIRAIKSVLRQDYNNWEMIIVDDCSTSWEQLQQYVTALNDPRITYIHNDINSGACAVRNQAIMLAQGEYITGIDDDDEWTPNRLSVFLAHKQQLVTHAFLYANDYVCQGEVYSNRQVCRCIQIAVFTPPVLQTQYHWQSGLYLGVAFQRVLVRYRTESGTGLRHLPADGGGVRRTVESRRGDADPAYQSRRNADHLVTEKILRILPLLPQAQRQIRPCQQKISAVYPLPDPQ